MVGAARARGPGMANSRCRQLAVQFAHVRGKVALVPADPQPVAAEKRFRSVLYQARNEVAIKIRQGSEIRTQGRVGLDVFELEPTVNPDYLTLNNVFLLPHLGSATIETRTQMGMICLDNISALLLGKPAPSLV